MENIRIESQNRAAYVSGKKYPFYNVVADSARFGKGAIMCQGTFSECLAYLERHGVDYLAECVKRNRGADIQVSFRMYTITEETPEGFKLRSRDGFDRFLKFADMTPTAPNTFAIPRDLMDKTRATVKMMSARAW